MNTKVFLNFSVLGLCLNDAFSADRTYYHRASETKQPLSSPVNWVNNPLSGYGYYYFYEYNISYHITSPARTTISVAVVVLDIPYNANCDDDRLLVYDGGTTTSTEIFTGCTPNVNVTLESTGNTLLVLFISDDDQNDYNRGFLMTFWMTGSVKPDQQTQNGVGYQIVCITMPIVAVISIIVNLLQACWICRLSRTRKLKHQTAQECGPRYTENVNGAYEEGRTNTKSNIAKEEMTPVSN